MTRPFKDHYYTSSDGLKLYARLYEAESRKLPLLCMHGLSRNSADFHDLVSHITDRPVISVDQRGRGRSDYDPDASNYRPDRYCEDMLTLLDGLGHEKVISVGTSMGGLMTFILSQMKPDLFAGAIINDIGPDIEAAGLARLRGYVGQSHEFENWEDAAEAIKAQGPDIFSEFTDADWLAFAGRVCELTDEGRVRFSYDPAISKGLAESDPTAAPPDLWPLFLGSPDYPMLVLRGETSDILSEVTASRMAKEREHTRLVTVPSRGHAPMLNEAVSLASIRDFLKDLP
ncbi:MAG: alpha/beta hydrolase [Pseudomonadota bacterium]